MMKYLLGILIGGGIGFTIGYFGKCASGTCPMTSNPYVSTVIGIIFGLIIARGK